MASLRWLAPVFGFAIALLAPGARAEASEPSAARLKLRLTLPVTQLLFVNPGSGSGKGAVALGGGSLEVELRELWAVEVGGNALVTSIQGLGHDLYARAGVVPVIRDGRREGRGWTTQLVALAGYRYLERYDSPDAHPGTEETHALRANLGLDWARRFTSVALGIRVLAGVTVPVSQRHTGSWGSTYFDPDDDLRYAGDLGVDVSIATP